MKNVSMCIATIFLFVQIANATGGLPVHNLTAPVKYVKVPMRFKSYSSYLQYVSIKAFKGVDSANAFYRKEFEEAAYNYTDYLPLTGGTLTGALAGTNANFSGTVSFGGNTSVGNTTNFAGYHFGIGATNGNGLMVYQTNTNSYVFGVLRDNTEGSIVNMYKADGSTIGNRISAYGTSYFNGGNIGIGTTTPGSVLQVNGGVAIGYSSSTSAPSNGLIVNGAASFGGNTSVGNTTNFAGYHFGIGATNGNGLMVYQTNANSYVFGVLRDNTEGSIVNMYKADGSTIGNRISAYGTSYFNGGNVGIGISSPSAKFHIKQSAQTSADGFRLDNSANDASLRAYNDGTNWVISPAYSSGGALHPILFTSSVGGANTLQLSTNGYVGIGTSSPDARFNIKQSAQTSVDGFRLDNSANDASMRMYNDGTNWIISPAYSSGGALHPVLFTSGIGGSNTLYLSTAGNVGIGTTSPTEKFSVNGNINAKKLIVTQTGWSDYVFDKNYKLRSLSSLETYINKNKHLPEVPTSMEVEKKGISVGDNQALLLKKIEELTLYLIAQQKQIDLQAKQIQQLNNNK